MILRRSNPKGVTIGVSGGREAGVVVFVWLWARFCWQHNYALFIYECLMCVFLPPSKRLS